jgi:hypothetical protein
MKRFRFVIPIMILVVGLALWMLQKDYSEIELSIRILIAVGAALLSGIISYFLMADEANKR